MDGEAASEFIVGTLSEAEMGEARVHNGLYHREYRAALHQMKGWLIACAHQDKVSNGFVSAVILRKVDPKTRETVTLPPMHVPSTHRHLAVQPTVLEARHFAATYALFRVCNMRNLHTMLPPNYRKLWKEDFAELKATAVKEGKGWLYEADPFQAKHEHDKAVAEREKKKAEREKQAQASQENVGLGLGAHGAKPQGKSWARAPKIDLGAKMRRALEELLQQHTIWNPYGVQVPEDKRREVIEDLTRLGFRRSHVEEAIAECKDREEALEWLLIYVPEDDLPRWCLPEGYSAGVTLVSGDLAREAKIKRLAAAGYPTDLCGRILDSHAGDEDAASEALQHTLLHGSQSQVVAHADSKDDVWEEEHPTLEAIYGDRYRRVSRSICEIKAEITGAKETVTIRFQKPSQGYPSTPPVISIISKGLPAYLRLSAVRRAVQHAEEDLIGQPMVFNLVDWLETNLPDIIEHPGKLRDISSIAATERKPASNLQIPILPGRKRPASDKQPGSGLSVSIREAWEAKQNTPAQKEMIQKRQSLPAWATQDAIIKAVNTYQVTIISGETGSGKSTQSVQFVLDDMIKRGLGAVANIVCTQPRRISALGLADRVSEERCCAVGDEVGYVIRGDSKVKPGTTKITFMTTGVLLRRIQTGDVASSLADITHVVVDEVHERSLDTDFLLALLRDILVHRKDLKVILMSATLDADIFTEYFGGPDRVGRVTIPGRTYPVEDYYLDDIVRLTGFNQSQLEAPDDGSLDTKPDSIGKAVLSVGIGINYDLIAATVMYIDSQLGSQPGGILIFLPGTMEIDRCLTALRNQPSIHALPLHASLQPAEQRRVFYPPPKGKRKVIAATNVAETSITIEDIVAVIDTGRVKETSYDPRDNIVRLQEVWASQAACKQRRGRAGRVRAGTCFKLFTRAAEANMPPRPEPEMRRVPLEQLCLTVLGMQGIEDAGAFLSKTITPPDATAVEGALETLHRIGALDSGKLTGLGRYLSLIPADLRLAKLMVYGSIFGCLDACVTIAAILSVKSPFVSPRDKRDEAAAARASFSHGSNDGDLLTDLAAYQQWSELVRTQGYRQTQSWCNTHFLSHMTLREIASNKAQFLSSLKDLGILPISYPSPSSSPSSTTHPLDRNSNSRALLRALIAGAFAPQIAQISFPDKKFASSITGSLELDPDARTIKYFTQDTGRVFLHPSSTLFSTQTYPSGTEYMAYFTKMASSKVFIRELTRTSAAPSSSLPIRIASWC